MTDATQKAKFVKYPAFPHINSVNIALYDNRLVLRRNVVNNRNAGTKNLLMFLDQGWFEISGATTRAGAPRTIALFQHDYLSASGADFE